MVRKIFLVVSLVLLIALGRSFFAEYHAQHTYYADMLSSWANWKIVLIGFIFGLIPAGYLLFAKHKKFRGVVGSLFAGLALFNIAYVAIKADLFGGTTKLVFNVIILLGLAIYMLVAFVAIGTWLKERVLKLPTEKIFDVITNLGMGLCAFLLISYTLILTNLFFPLVNWILFAGAGVLMWVMRDKLASIWEIINQTIDPISHKKLHPVRYVVVALPLLAYSVFSFMQDDTTIWTWLLLLISAWLVWTYVQAAMRHGDRGTQEIFSVSGMLRLFTFILVILSVRYIFNGFTLALIPYPTAWDANHAYMFYPKMRALHNGYYRNEISMSGGGAQLRYAFIAYWFSLFTPFTNFMGLSADSIAIEMNFWSGFLVLIFWLGLVAEILQYLQGENKDRPSQIHQLIFLVGWFLLLQWLMSGMGAFLVFIDNKTDLGVLALIILAIYSGFVFLRQATSEDRSILPNNHHRTARTLIGLSGFFYGIAGLAKATALFDVVNFGLFARWIWFGRIGVIGATLFIIWVLAALQFTGIKTYLPASVGTRLAPLGVVGIGADVVRMFMNKVKVFVRYLGIWAWVFLITFVVVKLPYRLADYVIYDRTTKVSNFVKDLFLGQTTEGHVKTRLASTTPGGLPLGRVLPLLTQATGQWEALPTWSGELMPAAVTPSMCNLANQWFTDAKELYTKIKKGDDTWYNEDIGRYTWYGWKWNPSDLRRGIKPFIDPWRAFLWSDGCHGFNPIGLSTRDAEILCDTQNQWGTLDSNQMAAVRAQLTPGSVAETMLGEIIELFNSDARSLQEKAVAYGPKLQSLESYMEDNTIKIVTNAEGAREVYFPYKFLNPFNISFNWSLQNLSSYYTDIGLVWIILFIFTFVGLIYGLVVKKHALVGISLVTLFGWILRWFIGGGILWYAIGIVVWTILSFLFYLYYLLSDEDQAATMTLSYLFVFAFIVFGCIQMTLNLVRLASQGGGGAFIRYKTNYGIQQALTETLQSANTPKGNFVSQDVFNLQFPHYNKIIRLANERTEDQGVFIAGTYLRYFIENQRHVMDDNFLGWLREMGSDDDTCNTYLRLKDNHITYMVIDPNIGTVVQGAGNQSLFDRFFARVNNVTNTIDAHGAMTMLVSLYQSGYLRYVMSNNLGAKYAFLLPDSAYGGLSGDQLTLFRARMSIARYFGQGMLQPIIDIAMQRVKDGTFVTDIADMMWLEIDENKMMAIVSKWQPTVEDIATLTQDERRALQQFIGIRQEASKGDDALRAALTNIVSNNAGGGNQLIVLQLVE